MIHLCSATGPFQQGDVLDMCVTGMLSVNEIQAQRNVKERQRCWASQYRHCHGDPYTGPMISVTNAGLGLSMLRCQHHGISHHTL